MMISELKELIKDLPDECVVGVHDHFGNIEEIDADDCEYYPLKAKDYPSFNRHTEPFFRLPNVGIESDPCGEW